MATTQPGKLRLADLNAGRPGITPAWGAALAEASAVCFEERKHQNGVGLRVHGAFVGEYEVCWDSATHQSRSCWNDLQIATEHGAYGLAILLVEDLTQYTVVERSKKGTGFDYWLGAGDEGDAALFENKARLEVSGILCGDGKMATQRVREKVLQIQQSQGAGLPGFVVVVEFNTPLSEVAKR